MKTIFYILVAVSIVSVGLIMYGIIIDSIRLFGNSVVVCLVSTCACILIAEELDNRRIPNNKN